MQSALSDDRPIIGITTGELKNLKRPNDTWVYGQNHDYVEMVEESGGAPMLIPSTDDTQVLDVLYEVMDGILLAGGNDVNPRLYEQEPHPTIEDVSRKRDSTEMYLLKRAEADKKPVFAICRGAQLWNIMNGGTLHQHIPEIFETETDHYNANKLLSKNHDVIVKRDSRLSKLLSLKPEELTISVNSYHHQAMDKLGRNLHPVAWAEDGIVEAIECDIEDWFIIGVQWHPESMEEANKILFDSFVRASINYNLIPLRVG